MKNTALATILSSLSLVTCAAQAQEGAALRQCRAMADTTARLACYDAIALPPLPATPAPAAAAAAPAVPSVPAATATPPAAPKPALEAQFGLPTPVDAVQEIVTRYEGLFEGWRANERIVLANGQVWQVVDGSSGVYNLKSPKVTIRRGALGRFVLDVEGANKTPTVRRVQ